MAAKKATGETKSAESNQKPNKAAPRSSAKKASSEKGGAKTTNAKKSNAKKTAAAPSTAKQTKSTSAARSTTKSAAKTTKAAAKTTKKSAAKTAKKTPDKAAASTKKSTTKSTTSAQSKSSGKGGSGAEALAVRPGERPWSARQLADVRGVLEADAGRLEEEISSAEVDIGALMREGGEGAGLDQADVGSNTLERDHEISMVKNARDQLLLVREALGRIDDGTYGICESCGQPIGKMRLQAFPRATLCMECKQRQERR